MLHATIASVIDEATVLDKQNDLDEVWNWNWNWN